jgi:tetratricopeptide (TPR) repeat protein
VSSAATSRPFRKRALLVTVAVVAALCLSGNALAARCGLGTHRQGAGAAAVCVTNSTSAGDAARVQQRLDDTTSQLQDIYVVFGIILALGFGASAFSWFTTTRRESKLAIGGESAAQKRAEDTHAVFLSQVQQAKETLELVNGTLALAESASRRAAEATVKKAKAKRNDLDKQARRLREDVKHRDDRVLVADPKIRERLTTLAEKIVGFENSQFILPEEITLTPPCRFIAAMAAHLKGQFDEAFDNWEAVALATTDAAPELRSAARYWVGYELNNLGDFEAARDSFQLALDEVKTEDPLPVARVYDIRRIILETEFFAGEDENKLIDTFEQLLGEMRNEPQPNEELLEVLGKVASTLGNVCLVAAQKCPEPATNRPLYERAIVLFREFEDSTDWARFGLAEALYALPEHREEGVSLFRERVRKDAQNEFDRREETRSKFRARATELVACLRVPDFFDEITPVADRVRDALAPVEERLTVYWPPEHKNIPKATVRDVELPRLLKEAEESIDGVT